MTAPVAAPGIDLDAPIDDIHDVLRADQHLAGLLRRRPGVRVPGAWDGFELAVRAILGQQISVKAATTIAGRIARTYGEPVTINGFSGLSHLFPVPERLARARFRFPVNPPATKEAYLYRSIFESHFPSEAAVRCVPEGPSIACSTPTAIAWDEAWAAQADPSGRAVRDVHKDGL